MVENVDVLVDKMVELLGGYIVHSFSDFYRMNTKRLKPHNRETLIEAIHLYDKNEKLCYELTDFRRIGMFLTLPI